MDIYEYEIIVKFYRLDLRIVLLHASILIPFFEQSILHDKNFNSR